MQQKVKVRIGIVPEHFNVIWYYAKLKTYFEQLGIDVELIEYPSGSSPLAIDMDSGTIDMAVILTDSVIKSITEGKNIQITGVYVESPLNWGIHTGFNSRITNINQIANKKFAVSRLGSGSHLIVKLYAYEKGFTINDDQFVVVENLTGAIRALNARDADVFFWDEFTTKPFVDDATFRLLDTFPTPWPAFVIAGNKTFLENNVSTVRNIVEIVQRTAVSFCKLQGKVSIISERYKQEPEDVQKWLQTVRWAKVPGVTEYYLQNIINDLIKAQVIPLGTSAENMLFHF